MKKLITLVMAMLLLMPTLPGCGNSEEEKAPDPVTPAAEFEYSKFTSETTGNTEIRIDKHIGESVRVVIPDTIDDLPVTAVGDSAFLKSKIEAIILPHSVITLGRGAFALCTSLAEVTLSRQITVISPSTFSACTALKQLKLPDSVIHIEKKAFENCRALESITLSSSLESIATEAFVNCYALKSITMPASLQTLGYQAFVNCTSLTTVTFAEGATKIGGPFAFTENCPKIKQVTIPSSATYLNPSTFVDLETVTFLGDAPVFGKNSPDGYSSPFISSNEAASGMSNEERKDYLPTIYYDPSKAGWDTTELRDYFHLVPIP